MNNFEKYKLKDIGKWEDRIYDFRVEDSKWIEEIKPTADRFALVTTAADILSHYDEISLYISGLKDAVEVIRLDPFDDGYASRLASFYEATAGVKKMDMTVPILVDRQSGLILSNDPFDIAKLFETIWSDNAFLRSYESVRFANEIFTNLYMEGYRAGYAEDQIDYDEGYQALFMEMDLLEKRLEGRDHLCDEGISDADVLLFSFLVRFDIQYVAAFRINRNLLRDFKNLDRYAKQLYSKAGFGESVDFDAIKKYAFLRSVVTNPYGKIPLGLDTKDWER